MYLKSQTYKSNTTEIINYSITRKNTTKRTQDIQGMLNSPPVQIISCINPVQLQNEGFVSKIKTLWSKIETLVKI